MTPSRQLLRQRKKPFWALILIFGAGTETQTRGLFLGKEALYQLSYTRICIKWWRLMDSNQRHKALQASALPTELSRHKDNIKG